MKKLILILSFLTLCISMQAQVRPDVINSLGGSSQYSVGYLAFSVGEPVIGTNSGSSTTLTQGFLQTWQMLAKQIAIKIFLEGLYAGSGTMNQAQGDTGPQFPAGIADKIAVELHFNSTPYGIFYEVNDIDLHTDGTLQVNNLPANTSSSYYITIKHRNSIQTWSALPYDFSGAGPFSYDFSTAATQAYGDNQKDMLDGYFAIYCGDVDQDGGITVVDMGLVDNQSAIFGGGYIPEDIDGDGGVSTIDMGLIDNNSAAFVGAVFPGAKKRLVPLNK
jgi:hypothetical protein